MLNLQFKQRFCYFALIMKCLSYISLLLCCILGLGACTGPVIVEEEEKVGTDTGQEHKRDSVPIIHNGTYDSPYTIGEVQTLGRGKGIWIEGYIVGTVSGSMKNGCNYSHNPNTKSNILLADTFPTGSDYDYLYCIPVKLPDNSSERDDLNLYDNPDNYHRKVRIEGDVTLYFKVAGIDEITNYIFVDEEDNDENENEDVEKEEDNTEKPEEPLDPDDTRKDTLSIAEGIKLQKEIGYEQACIRGYIIGYAKGNNSVVYIDSETAITSKAKENVVLADNLDERDNKKIIVVELPKHNSKDEGPLRNEVNLYDNPQNLHKRLTVTGMMTPYYGLAGCTETLGAENRERFLLE